MKKFKAYVRISGNLTWITIDAPDLNAARRMLEAQYGSGCISSIGPA
jgi:hypothetical protein